MTSNLLKKSITLSALACTLIVGCGSGGGGSQKVVTPSSKTQHKGEMAIGLNTNANKIKIESAKIGTSKERLLTKMVGSGNSLVKELKGFDSVDYFEMTDSEGNTFIGVIGTTPTNGSFDKVSALYKGDVNLFLNKNNNRYLLEGNVNVTINYGNSTASILINDIGVVNSSTGQNVDFGTDQFTIKNVKLEGNTLLGSQQISMEPTMFDGQANVNISGGLFGNDQNQNIADEVAGIMTIKSKSAEAEGIFITD